jgi:hypothetical protein
VDPVTDPLLFFLVVPGIEHVTIITSVGLVGERTIPTERLPLTILYIIKVYGEIQKRRGVATCNFLHFLLPDFKHLHHKIYRLVTMVY